MGNGVFGVWIPFFEGMTNKRKKVGFTHPTER
jgi:hypothetical protein